MSQQDRWFDYVIVGAGPSALGLVLGLLERCNADGGGGDDQHKLPSIAVIERGGRPSDSAKTRDLSQWYPIAHQSNSPYTRLIGTSIVGRVLDLPIGQGLGGGSIINAGLVAPPPQEDYAKWPEPWASLLPVAVEDIWQRLDKMHLLQPLVGSDLSLDCHNGWEIDWGQRCATLEQQMPDGSRNRRTYFQVLALLLLEEEEEASLLDTENNDDGGGVVWILDTQVQRLLMSHDTTVQGVECITGGGDDDDLWRCYATKAVILCAGAIESPALLLTSGIGPETDQQYQGVGCHLQDQVLIPRVFFTRWHPPHPKILSSNGIAQMGQFRRNNDIFQIAIVDATSHATIIPSALATVLRRDLKSPFLRVLVEIVFQAVQFALWFLIRWTPLGYFLRHYTHTVLLFWMHPRSEGSIRIEPSLSSRTTTTEPCQRRNNVTLNVHVGYGRDPRDWEIHQEAWCDLQPPPDVYDLIPQSGLDLLCRHASLPYFHFMGTCAMKRNEAHVDWVVDPWHLKLRNHEGLYICDASVFPAFVSVPPALTCFALGYAFSEALLASSKIPPPSRRQE